MASFSPLNFGTASWRRTWRRLLLGGVCAGALLTAGAADLAKEYQLKAAFLYNFTKFVEWPPQRLATADAPIVIGVLGEGGFDDELARIVAGRQVNGHAVVVRVVGAADDLRGIHVLFVPVGQEGRYAEAAAGLRGAAVLTVGESERFASLGGMIVFARDDGKVRFSVNLESSDEAQLRLSAQLLKLAAGVRRKS